MFDFLKKKPKEENTEAVEGESTEEPAEESEGVAETKTVAAEPKVETAEGPSVSQLSVQIEKLNASVESFGEVRKSFSERFSRISEQIGELRSMILERDKTIQQVELKAVKAHDLVDAVQPEKITTQLQKDDAKIEALKANLEGNESIMTRLMDEVKEVRRKVDFFRGVEEVIKLSEEVKKDLTEIKKVESRIALNTDKVETVYAEMKKKFQVLDVFDSTLQETKARSEQGLHDIQFLKDKIIDLASKEDLDKLVNRVQQYITALRELEKKSSMGKDIDRLKAILEGLK